MAKEKTKEKRVETTELMIPVEQFRATRDTILQTLNTLQGDLQSVQSGIQKMISAYLSHTASVLAGGSGALEPLPIGNSSTSTAPILRTDETPGERKRGRPKKGAEKERKKKDPNAPKRPLTAAFLYSQQAREIVKKDMEDQLPEGEKLQGNAVNQELTRRWMEMPDDEKELWKESYRESLAEYQHELAEYNKQRGIEHTAAELEGELDDAFAGAVPSDIEASSSDDSDEDSPARAKAPTPPTVTPKANKSKKLVKSNGVVPPPILPASTMRSTVAVPAPVRATSVKPPGITAASPAVESVKGKSKKHKEPSPEESKKKRARRNAVEDEEEVAAPQEPPKKKSRKKKDASS